MLEASLSEASVAAPLQCEVCILQRRLGYGYRDDFPKLPLR